MTDLDYKARLYRPQDEDFVLKSWLDSFSTGQYGHRFRARDGSRRQSHSHSWDRHRNSVLALLSECRVEVICDAQDERIIYAWACSEDKAVHYALVKHSLVADGFGPEMLGRLFGSALRSPMTLTHEPVWVRHVRETRADYVANHPDKGWAAEAKRADEKKFKAPPPPDVITTENGAMLPYYYQPHASFFPLPTDWRLDEYFLSHKWCPGAA